MNIQYSHQTVLKIQNNHRREIPETFQENEQCSRSLQPEGEWKEMVISKEQSLRRYLNKTSDVLISCSSNLGVTQHV